VARKVLGGGVKITGGVVQIGTEKVDPTRVDWATVRSNPFWCPDPIAAKAWEGYLDGIRKGR